MTHPHFEVKLPPDLSDAEQYSEHFILLQAGEERRLRLHDYETIYTIPGLYEAIVCEALGCTSQDMMPRFLAETVQAAGVDVAELTALDFGAGIGLVGAALAEHGLTSLIGLDILPQAKAAVHRDHPGLYQAYFVEDICHLSDATHAHLQQLQPNCLICVSAIGLGRHVSPPIFTCAYNLMPPHSWVAFNLNTSFLEPDSPTGYPQLLDRLADNRFDLKFRTTYHHRRLTDGTPIDYTAFIGQKLADLP